MHSQMMTFSHLRSGSLRATCVLLVLLAVACGSNTVPTSTEGDRAELVDVPWPRLDDLEESVQEHLALGRAQLDQAIAAGDARAQGRLYGQLGMYYQAYDFRDAAEACYRNAVATGGRDHRWHYYLAHLLRERGASQESIEQLGKATELEPNYVPSLVTHAQVLLDEQELPDAARMFGLALTMDPDCAAAHAGLGAVAAARQDHARAVEHYESALELEPNASAITHPLGLAHRELGNVDRARELLEGRGKQGRILDDPLLDAVDSLVTGMRVHQNRGTIAHTEGRYEDAAREFRLAIEADPESALPRTNLGTVLTTLGDLEGAIEQYREAVRLDPDYVTARFNLGVVLARTGQADEAIVHYREALRVDPKHLGARFNLANAHRRRGEYREAASNFVQVVQADAGHARAHHALGLVLVELKEWPDARRSFEMAHRLKPTSARYAESLARLLATCPLDNLRDGARAQQLAAVLVAANRSLEHVETNAMALAEIGELGEAATQQQAAIEAAERAGRPDLVARLNVNLALYQAGQPCREPWTKVPISSAPSE